MKVDILKQIVKEFKEMSDESLDFSTWWCDEDDVVTMCPIGNHITNHTELFDMLDVKLDTISHKGHNKKAWRIGIFNLSKYLEISEVAANWLFTGMYETRDGFVKLMEEFISGEIDIRKCAQSDCGSVYVTDPTDKACVCDYCKEDLLLMCGMEHCNSPV